MAKLFICRPVFLGPGSNNHIINRHAYILLNGPHPVAWWATRLQGLPGLGQETWGFAESWLEEAAAAAVRISRWGEVEEEQFTGA